MAAKTVFVTRDLPSGPKEAFLALDAKLNIWESEDQISPEELLKCVPGHDALICTVSDRIDKAVLDAAGSNLKTICTISVGYDHIDVEECKKRNIVIGNTPGVLTDAVAELTVGLLLTTTRRLAEAVDEAKSGKWTTWKLMWLCGVQLTNRVIGVVGLGRIGFAVAERLAAFGVSKILYTSRSEKPEAAKFNGILVDFDTLLRESDIVIVCCALTSETRGLFDKIAFTKMKKSSIIINSSRGQVINQEDLYEALVNGQIQAAGLDVTTPEPLPPNHPLMGLKNCVVFPHIGSATVDTRTEVCMMTLENLKAALSGQPLPFAVF